MIASLIAAAAVAAQSGLVAPAPSLGATPQPTFVEFPVGEVRCDDVAQRAVFSPPPRVATTYLTVSQSLSDITLAFRISPAGRPLGIGQPTRGGTPGKAPYIALDDLAPTLAGWQFAPGGERRGCTVIFTPRATPIATAPRELVQRYAALPRKSALGWTQALGRLRTFDRGCNTPSAPRPLLRAFPDYPAIAQPLATIDYSVVGYDLDASGKPVALRIIGSEGNAALDRAALDATARSRFAGGARQGCSLPYYRGADTPLAAPPPPETAALRPAGATCGIEHAWARTPVLVFPDEFRRRQIEGWAIISFDVAPWGAPGNVEIIASEPAAAFGEQARQVVQAATKTPSSTGATGCVERVIFRMSRASNPESDEQDDRPAPF